MLDGVIVKLNDNEKKVLNILEKDPYISQQLIADQMKISRPAVANLISGLQDKGYILGKPYVLRKYEYITCIGGANLDYTFRLEQDMILGTSNPVQSSISYGGVIRNVADNLARLNNHVSLMSVVGDDLAGNDLLMHSKKIMETFAVDKLAKKNTGGYYSIIGKNGHMNVGYADMSINEHMDRAWILEHKKHLRFSNWLIADTNLSKDALEALIDFSRQEEKSLAIVGVSGPKMKHIPDDLKDVEIIICNVDETQAYFQTKETDLEILIKLWLDKGIKKAVITAGNKGCLFADQANIYHQKAVYVSDENIIDVTGAGDAFSAAVLHGIIHDVSFEQSVKYGVISSSLTIQSPYSVHPKLSINLIKKELEKYENI